MLKRKSLIFFSTSTSKKCLSRLYKFVYKFCQQKCLYPNLWFVYRICQENSVKQMCTICQQNLPRILSLKSIHKFCQQRSVNLSTIITNLFQSVYSVSRNLSTKESTNLYTICHYSGNNLSLESVHKRIHESVNNLSLFWKQFVTILLSGVHKYTLSSVG